MKQRFMPTPFRLSVHRSHSGRGLFAQERIRKGSCVIEYIGRPATPRQMKLNRGKYLFWTSDTTMIDGNIPANVARFINHSCKPNCYSRVIGDTVWICAGRNIKKGEELSYDYNTGGEAGIKCHCRPGCKNFI